MAVSLESFVTPTDADETPLDLLILGCSQSDAYRYAEVLRNTGLAVHMKSADSRKRLAQLIETEPCDLVLLDIDSRTLPYLEVLETVYHMNPGACVVMIADAPDAHAELLDGYEIRDLISSADEPRLGFVVRREHATMLQRQRIRNLDRQLRESENRCAALINSSRDAIAYVHAGMHVNVNPVYLDMFGFEYEEDMTGLPLMDLISPNDRRAFKRILRDVDETEHHEHQIRCRDVHGDTIEVLMEFSPASVDGEACTQILIRDRSRQQALEREIDELRNRDLQTGLYNRNAFMTHLEERLADIRNSDDAPPLGVVHFAVSNLPLIRQNSGVEPADKVLKEISEVLRRCAGDEHSLARFGDHQFALIEPDGARVSELAERCLSTLRSNAYREVAAALIPPHFAVGVLRLAGNTAISTHECVDRVCRAGTQAEAEGENRVVLYSDDLPEQAHPEPVERDQTILSLIDTALEDSGFKLVYQPIVSLQGDTRENYSVLLRVPAAEENNVPLVNFMHQAAAANRMAEIDRWVIRNAIKELVAHRAEDKKVNFHVMISHAGIEDESLLLWVCDCLREFKAKGAWLVFQFNEQDVRSALQAARPLIEGLKKVNCRIAIDHFSEGPDGDALLKHLGADIVRLSPEHVHDLADDASRQDKLADLNRHLQAMGVKTVATGVEDANSLAMLWNIGLNYIQGYFLQEPAESINYDIGV